MENCFITFRSVTFGQRGQRLLEQAGISCTLQRTPRWMEQQGCGYCLKLRETNCQMAVAMLRHHQVPFQKVYRQVGGEMEALL